MAISEIAQRRLLRSYMARQETIAAAGGAVMVRAWDQLDSFDEANIARFRELALPATLALTNRAGALSAAYLAALLREPVVAATRPVEPDFRGPFTRLWGAIGRGESFDDALMAGSSRAEASGRNAVVSTARRVGDQLESDQIVGWRRVLDADPCEWCVSVSGQTYKSAESADFGHDRCGCGVTPKLR
jgi:hypothetical protein